MQYIAFFRGINVGGKNVVKMIDLKKLFTDMGFQDVRTYIQSGNVIFSSDRGRTSLAAEIECVFQKQFGFRSPVILRSGTELTAILDAQPFSAAEIRQAEEEYPDVEHLYVHLFDAPLNSKNIEQACSGHNGKDKICVAEHRYICSVTKASGIQSSPCSCPNSRRHSLSVISRP